MEKEGWKFIGQFFERERLSPILIILGVVFSGLAGLGAWPYPYFAIEESGRHILLTVGVGSFLCGVVFYFVPLPFRALDPKKYGFRFTTLRSGSVVKMNDSAFNVEGTFKKKLPDGYRAMILELEGQGKFRPRKYVDLNEPHNIWTARSIWGGSESGVQRTIAIAIVGPTGAALVKYFEKVGEVYEYKKRPSIEGLPPDIRICQQIDIVTG